MASRLQLTALFVLATAVLLLVSSSHAQSYQYGQATFYDSISHGFCGYGSDIPSNGFVAAWPFIETDPRTGTGYPQPGNGECGACFEVSCVPQFVESADGSIYLDRRDACADPNRAVIVKIVDECRCSLPRDSNLPRGNFNWCCNTPTPKLKVDRHIDLSKQAFSALVKDGNFGIGIIGIRYRRVACGDIIGVTSLDNAPPPPPTLPAASSAVASVPTAPESPPPEEGKTWYDAAKTQPDRGSSQSLPLNSQCGGRGGACRSYGGNAACDDAPFAGWACGSGLSCQRQHQYYYQCLPDQDNTSAGDTNDRPGSSDNSVQNSGSSKTLQPTQQCGGRGAKCNDYGSCDDAPFPGYTCASGLACKRQNEWWWECGGGGAPKSTLLAEVEQCGGRGAWCQSYGNKCGDRPFPGYACGPGLECVRQDEWYYQCKRVSGDAAKASSSLSESAGQAGGDKVVEATKQCGGTGAKCGDYGACADKPFPGIRCADGTTCTRQNEWWWECRA